MDQNNNFNTQGYNTNNQNFNNNIYQPPINNQPQKKSNLGLIIGIAAVAVVVVVGVVFGSKFLSKNNENSNNETSNNSVSTEVIYYDNTRSLKDSYTFKEAVSKFAFKVNETTLIFEENDKTTLEMMMSEETIHNDLWNTQFEYKQDIYTSLGTMYLGESNSSTLEEFKTNFNNGILSDNTKWTVENVNIIESNNEYIFASWTNKAFTTTNEYYFAKIIGNKVFYAYHSTLVAYNDTKTSLLLEQFKNLFTCLSEDDGTEPYIYDKIMNVPIVLNKKIKDVNLITAVINSNNDYLDGSVSLTDEIDYVNLEYGASGHYNKIDWTKTFDSNTKYAKEDEKNIIGIKDNNNTQLFEITIYSDKQITNTKEFNSYISAFLTDK